MEYFGIARWAWELYDYSYTSYKVISTFTGCCKGEECIITAALKYISVWGIFLLLLRHQRCKWLFSHSQQHVKKWWNTQKSTSTTRSTGRTAGSYFSSWSSALSKHQQYISPGAECNCGIFAQVMAHQPLMIPRISHRQFSFFFFEFRREVSWPRGVLVRYPAVVAFTGRAAVTLLKITLFKDNDARP